MALLKQSTAFTRMFLMVQSADHLTALTGATCTVNISKAGAAFGAAGGTVTEVANGWYKVALTTTDTNTVGDLAYHITATSGDPTDFVDQVSAQITSDLMATYTQPTGFLAATFPTGTIANTTNLTAGTVAAVTGQLTAAQIATGVWQDTTAGDFTTALSVGKSVMNGVSLGTGLTVAAVSGAVGSVTGAVGSVTARVAITSNVTTNAALVGFPFEMTDSTTHNPKTGVTVTGTKSLDGGLTFTALTNAPYEKANGWYAVDLAAADTNAKTCIYRFTGTGADDCGVTLITQP